MVAMADRESVLEDQTARVLAEITRLQDELDSGDLVTEGSKGQPVPNRLLAELRSHRWLLVRMLTDGPAPPGPPAADAVDALRAEWEDSGAV
jgi:hypothetical protein